MKPFIVLGQCYLHLNQLREAEHWFNFSLVSKPDHVPAHLTLANLHSRRGLLNKAIEWYSRALKLEPENKEIYQRFGRKTVRVASSMIEHHLLA